MLFQSSLGIDIRYGAVSVVYLKASFKGVRVAAHATHALREDNPLGDNLHVVAELVKDFIRRHGITSTDVFLGIPRDKAIFRYIEMPLAVKENLRASLSYEMEKYVPFSEDDVHFGHQILAEDKKDGKLKVLAVFVRKDMIAPYFDLVQRLGIGVSGIETTSTALANTFSCEPGTPHVSPCAAVYLEKDYFEFNLLQDDRLHYSRSVRLEEPGEGHATAIQKELGHVRQVLRHDTGRLEMVLCGPLANEDLLRKLTLETDLRVNLADFTSNGIPSDDLLPAFGLALKGLKKVPMQINLLSPELRREPSRAGRNTMLVLLGLILLLSLGWGGSYVFRQRLVLDNLNFQIKALEAEVSGIERIGERSKELVDRISFLEEQYRSPVPVLAMLKDLTERVPENAWVSELTFSGKDVVLKGHAGVASELIPLLEASPLLTDVIFLSTIVKAKDGTESFRIGLKVN